MGGRIIEDATTTGIVSSALELDGRTGILLNDLVDPLDPVPKQLRYGLSLLILQLELFMTQGLKQVLISLELALT